MLSLATFRSSIGKKIVMGVSGLLLLGFVVGHLCGNLLIFFGPDALNAYAKKLKDLGPLLWVARISLIVFVVAHIVTAIQLTLENREARGTAYVHKAKIQTTYAARTMMISGIIVLAYIIYHLMHFTFLITNPDISHFKDALGRHDVYSMVVLSFQKFPISAVYIVATFLLCNHLKHGIGSLFQTLGLADDKSLPLFKNGGAVFAILLFLGYASIPIAVLSGHLTTGVTP